MTTFDQRSSHSRASSTGIRIACVYRNNQRDEFKLANMADIRFYRMAEALARRGHDVDIIINLRSAPTVREAGLREVPFSCVRWHDYDLIKTFFHRGFESLAAEHGSDHPFIVSKLGSVVGPTEGEGVYFFGEIRERLFRTQQALARRSRVVTVLTNRSAALWLREHGADNNLYMVPTGVDAEIPPPRSNPYLARGITEPVALFAGNLYLRQDQPEINLLWQDRLNRLGRALGTRGIRLVAMGTGETDYLDPEAVLHVGAVDAAEIWDWQRFAKVGLVLAQGQVQDNESSKIYYYLRTGLPVVCERPVPNRWLIEQTGLGALVDYQNDEALVDAALSMAFDPPQNHGVEQYTVENHSWDARAALYQPVVELAAAEAGRIRKWA